MCCNMKQRNYNTLPCGVLPADIRHKKHAENTDTSELSRLLKIVYAADKRTGLPSGELTVLASDSVPAEVANWVRTQLLNPMPDNSVSSIVGNTQLDDDTILSLVRNVGESDIDYINRCDSNLRAWNEKHEES